MLNSDPQNLNPIETGPLIGTKQNCHITMLLHAKYKRIYIPGSLDDF